MVQRRVLMGLGSNCEPREQFLQLAVDQLSALDGLQDIRVSSLYQCPALLPEGAPADWDKPFLNMALLASTHLEPHALLSAVKGIEQRLGRVARGLWGPREIDIDVLHVEGVELVSDDLTLPHKHFLARDFVVIPVAELWPEWIHPHDPTQRPIRRHAQAMQVQTSLTLYVEP